MKKLILSVYDAVHSSLNRTSTTIKEISHEVKQKTLTYESDFLNDPFFIDIFYKKMVGFDKKSYNKKRIKAVFYNRKGLISGVVSTFFISLISSFFNNDIMMFITVLNAIMSGMGAFLLLFIILDDVSENIISNQDEIVNKIEFSHEDYYLLSEVYNKETIKNLLEIMEREDRFRWNSFDSIVELQEEKNGIESLTFDGNNLSSSYMKKIKRNDYAESLYLNKK